MSRSASLGTAEARGSGHRPLALLDAEGLRRQVGVDAAAGAAARAPARPGGGADGLFGQSLAGQPAEHPSPTQRAGAGHRLGKPITQRHLYFGLFGWGLCWFVVLMLYLMWCLNLFVVVVVVVVVVV